VEGWIETIRVDETVEILPVGVPDIDRVNHGGVHGGDCLDELVLSSRGYTAFAARTRCFEVFA